MLDAPGGISPDGAERLAGQIGEAIHVLVSDPIFKSEAAFRGDGAIVGEGIASRLAPDYGHKVGDRVRISYNQGHDHEFGAVFAVDRARLHQRFGTIEERDEDRAGVCFAVRTDIGVGWFDPGELDQVAASDDRPLKQNTLVDDLLWAVFNTADSSDLWGHARRDADTFRSAVRSVLEKHGIDTSGIAAQVGAPGSLSVHIERGQALRVTAVRVGDKTFVPDPSVKDTEEWAVQMAAAAQSANVAVESAAVCAHTPPNLRLVVYNDLVSPPGRLSVGWCANCGAYYRSHPVGGVFGGEWESPTGYGEIRAAWLALQEQLIREEANTDRMSELCDENAAEIAALKQNIERLQAERRDNGLSGVAGALARAGIFAPSFVQGIDQLARERDSKAATVKDLLEDIDNRNRVIDQRTKLLDEAEQQLWNGLEGRIDPAVKHADTRLDDIIANASQVPPNEGIPVAELPAEIRAEVATDLQAMDVAEVKRQLAQFSPEFAAAAAKTLADKILRKYDQDVVDGIADDLVRTKQTGAGLYGLAPAEKEFVCLARAAHGGMAPSIRTVGTQEAWNLTPGVPPASDLEKRVVEIEKSVALLLEAQIGKP